MKFPTSAATVVDPKDMDIAFMVPTDAEIILFSTWLAESFKEDLNLEYRLGKSYTQDESLWRIFFQMQLYTARNVSGAKFISNTNRTAFRIFRPPRVQLGDAADLAKDAYDRFVNRAGPAFLQKKQAMELKEKEVNLAAYGPNSDATSTRTAFLGVKSDRFGRGIGTAIQDFTEKEASKYNLPLRFYTGPVALPMYLARGYIAKGVYKPSPEEAEAGLWESTFLQMDFPLL